jgi:hypothetical protein
MMNLKIFPFLLLASLVACQSASPPPDQPTSSPSPPAGPGGPSGITGQVVSASDVGGQPDVPLADQLVLAIPVESAPRLLGLNLADLTQENLRFLHTTIVSQESQITTTLTDNQGNYTLQLPPDEYVICLADAESPPAGFPVNTRGCGRVTVPSGQLLRVDISSGFGEILLEQP